MELTEPGTIEVIKAHGSFGISSPLEIVIANEDYEDYTERRPAMTARLRSDLLTKSFLFVGYGYGDPNIRAVLVEARRLAGRTTLPHWMLTKAIDPTDPEKAQRQLLWKSDLERMGIRCVLVPNYGEIERIVGRVSRRSRGPTIYVTGSHTVDNSRAADVGRLLADAARPPHYPARRTVDWREPEFACCVSVGGGREADRSQRAIALLPQPVRGRSEVR